MAALTKQQFTALDRLRRFSLEPNRFYDGAGINGTGRGKKDSRDNLSQIEAAKGGSGGGVDGSGHGGSNDCVPSNTLFSGSPGPLGPRPGKATGRRGRGDLERNGDNGLATAFSIRGEGMPTRAVRSPDSVSLVREETDRPKPQHIIMPRDISNPAHPSALSSQGAPRGEFGITDQDPIYYVSSGQVETICASMDAEADSTRLFVGIEGSRGGGSGEDEGGRGDDIGGTQAGVTQVPALNLNVLRYAPPLCICVCI
jgi:hypothetical protein